MGHKDGSDKKYSAVALNGRYVWPCNLFFLCRPAKTGTDFLKDKSVKKVPGRLFKYRPFDNRTLDQLISDRIYFADPREFNDPLDARPSLTVDLDTAKLEAILTQFIQRRTKAEMDTAAKALSYSGPKTKDHIERIVRRRAERAKEDISYHATNPEYECDNPQSVLLGYEIEAELLRSYEKGIVALAEQATCPLMWSHYGDQHKGVCIGYSVPEATRQRVHKVNYGGKRAVKASEVAAMLDENDKAESQVYESVFLRKAQSWGYEREWRLIGTRGLQESPLELEEVIFGMRCEPSLKYAVVKALERRKRSPKFFEIGEMSDSFKLRKLSLSNDDELFHRLPMRSLSIDEVFSKLSSP